MYCKFKMLTLKPKFNSKIVIFFTQFFLFLAHREWMRACWRISTCRIRWWDLSTMSAAWSSAARGWCPYAEITRAPVLSVARGSRRGFGKALQQKHCHWEPWRPSLLSRLHVQPGWLVVALQTHAECGTQQQPPLWPKPRYWHGSVTLEKWHTV